MTGLSVKEKKKKLKNPRNTQLLNFTERMVYLTHRDDSFLILQACQPIIGETLKFNLSTNLV